MKVTPKSVGMALKGAKNIHEIRSILEQFTTEARLLAEEVAQLRELDKNRSKTSSHLREAARNKQKAEIALQEADQKVEELKALLDKSEQARASLRKKERTLNEYQTAVKECEEALQGV